MTSTQDSDSSICPVFYTFLLNWNITYIKYQDINYTTVEIFTYVDALVATTQINTLDGSLVSLPSHSLPLP